MGEEVNGKQCQGEPWNPLAGFCLWTPLKQERGAGLWLQQENEELDTEKNFLTMQETECSS